MSTQQKPITLSDVVDKLYGEFDKINDPTLTGEKLNDQLNRTKTVISISKQIVETATLALDAQKALPDMLDGLVLPPMLRIEK